MRVRLFFVLSLSVCPALPAVGQPADLYTTGLSREFKLSRDDVRRELYKVLCGPGLKVFHEVGATLRCQEIEAQREANGSLVFWWEGKEEMLETATIEADVVANPTNPGAARITIKVKLTRNDLPLTSPKGHFFRQMASGHVSKVWTHLENVEAQQAQPAQGMGHS